MSGACCIQAVTSEMGEGMRIHLPVSHDGKKQSRRVTSRALKGI